MQRLRHATSVIACLALLVSCGTQSHRSASTGAAPVVAAVPLPLAPVALAAAINSAQRAIDDPATTAGALVNAALTEQLAARRLAGESRPVRRATLTLLRGRTGGAMSENLAAALALAAISTRPTSQLPRWRIVQPPSPGTLRGLFESAQARYLVPWQDLAAIEFIETRFGRVNGVSSAGAQGPMQFLPSTWARYGSGSIRDPRRAINAAARFLVANGARHDIARALYAYNNSVGYVDAVLDYARWMRADARAYYGYYDWQVIFNQAGGAVILPFGYPKSRPVPIGNR